MNNQIKILFTVQGIAGGTLRPVGKQVFKYVLAKKDINLKYKGKDKNQVVKKGLIERINYETVPCSRTIKMTQDAYDWFTSEESKPRTEKLEKSWKKMSKKARLEVHLQKICTDYGGTSFVYSILED